jgi:hypothetical protein
MKLEIAHVERPELPWRKPEQRLTECGLTAASYPTITRSELVDRVKEWGEQRTAMTVCMTCYQTAQRWNAWEENPIDAIRRAANNEPHWNRFAGIPEAVRTSPLLTELRAIAILIDRHHEEFDKIVVGLGEVVNLDQKREEQRRKRMEERRNKRPSKW